MNHVLCHAHNLAHQQPSLLESIEYITGTLLIFNPSLVTTHLEPGYPEPGYLELCLIKIFTQDTCFLLTQVYFIENLAQLWPCLFRSLIKHSIVYLANEVRCLLKHMASC